MKRLLFCLFLLLSFSTVSATNYNYTIDCITDSNGNIVKSTDPISSDTTYKIVQKEFENINEDSNTTFCVGKLVSKEAAIVYADTSTSYIGYYADIDGDGTVDGVIFADLAFSKSGTWNTCNTSKSAYNTRGTYSYSAQSNLKQYYVSQESYTGKFGTAAVLSPVSGTTGNDRFYVMALSDFTTFSSYYAWYWYKSAYSTTISDYSTITSQDFGSGKQNTANMISKWNSSAYGSQNAQDIWGAIQTQVANGWFVPSRAEWAAFANAFPITSNYNGSGNSTCSGNYNLTYGLSNYYWSSSLGSANDAYGAFFNFGYMNNYYLDDSNRVRLVVTY